MAPPKLIIGNRNYSSWSLRAWLCMRKSGVTFDEVLLSEMHSGYPHLRNAMPMNFRARDRRVPVTPELNRDIERMVARWSLARESHAEQGPWLLGQYSIADAFFAPVVVRFGGYGVEVPEGPARDYCFTVRADPDLRHWQEQAAREDWVVDADEAGEPGADESRRG